MRFCKAANSDVLVFVVSSQDFSGSVRCWSRG